MMDLSDFISETIAEITTGLLAGQQRVAAHGVDIKTAGGDQGDITNQPANNYTYNDIGQLTGNKQDGHYFRYNVTGKVTGVYGDANHTSPIAGYAYDDRGFRIKKTDPKTTTHYVRDVAGSILAVYNVGPTLYGTPLAELPIYGAGRIGVAYNWIQQGKRNLTHTYELSDHLGNVRAVVQKKSNTADVTHSTDYYPYGWRMPGRVSIGGERYRFGYQGQFAEYDPETGYNQFEARLLDTRLGRWLTTDPAGAGFSPYWSMNNNPVKLYDPDGKDPPLEHEYESGYVWSDIDGTWKWNGGSHTWAGLDGADDIFGSMMGLNEIVITRYMLDIFRDKETNLSTTSWFIFNNLKGVFLEPKGPETILRGLNRRIPAGLYNLDHHNGTKFQDVFILYNDQVPRSRGILIHTGNKPINTSGCLLPGCSRTTDFVFKSQTKFDELYGAFYDVGVENVIVKIHNTIHLAIPPVDNSLQGVPNPF